MFRFATYKRKRLEMAWWKVVSDTYHVFYSLIVEDVVRITVINYGAYLRWQSN